MASSLATVLERVIVVSSFIACYGLKPWPIIILVLHSCRALNFTHISACYRPHHAEGISLFPVIQLTPPVDSYRTPETHLLVAPI